MATYIEVNNVRYPASITGRINDGEWNNRASKAITVEMSYVDAITLFIDEVEWNIIHEVEELVEKYDENGEVVIDENGHIVYDTVIRFESYDNSEYCIAGDITDHRNGTVTIKMGKPTAEELLAILIGG